MEMKNLVMGWSDGLELLGKNIEMYSEEIERSIFLVCRIKNIEFRKDVVTNMINLFRINSEFFPEILQDLIYNYTNAQEMNHIDKNYNLVCYMIKLYELYLRNNGSDEGLLEMRIEYGFVDLLKKLSDVKLNGFYDTYNKVYESAKSNVDEWFNKYSAAKYLVDDNTDFMGFIQLKSEIRSHIISDLIKHDNDQIFREPRDMDQLTVISAVMAEILAVMTILKYKNHANLNTCNFYFKNITNEDRYEIIKTR
nr:MAG TPA: hypothetical protein [Caudoviricetes sp.]